MSTTRRDFLMKSAVVALAAGVPASVTSSIFGKSISVSGSALNRADFAANLNTTFDIKNGGTTIKTTLVEVSALKGHSKVNRAGKEGFTLLFQSDRSIPLKQNTYVIEHEKLGTFSFLIVPTVTRDKDSLYYTAVINRLYP